MGLFDLFSSDSGEKAAQQGYNAQKKGNDEALKTLKKGQRKAVGAIDTATGQAAPLYQSLLDAGNKGATAYGDATGVNGQAGYDNAVNMFHTNPGYQFQLDQGLQALDRNHAANGSYNSGGWGADALKYSQGLADQSWNTHLAQLAPYLGIQESATSGLGSLYSHAGDTKAGVYTGMAGPMAGVNQAQGQAGYQLAQNQFGAQQSANSNLWNAILGVGGLASSFI